MPAWPQAPTYEALWRQLGPAYTMHGALMVVGRLLFTGAALRAAGPGAGADGRRQDH